MSLDVPQSVLDVAERGGIGDGMRWFSQSAMAFFKTPVSWLRGLLHVEAKTKETSAKP